MQNSNILSVVFVFFVCFSCVTQAQNNDDYKAFAKQLHDSHEQFREKIIQNRRFKHADLQPLIEKLKQNQNYRVQKIGNSLDGRAISMISIGKGATNVLLWSQMHGDEPTATMSIFDMFNFFNTKNALDSVKSNIFDKLTLHFIPMLNPDGAEAFKRRTNFDVDLNRDALRLQNPEAVLLKKMRDSLNAVFGFNLHDQSLLYTAGNTPNPATISFLAPAYNNEKEINEVRGNAMKLIGEMTNALAVFIPKNVGKYNDDHEPRAFGDNIQKWGTSVILIESGGYPKDTEKQYIRKLNFVAILSGLRSIADKHYEKYSQAEYDAIPFNDSQLKHLILRNLNFTIRRRKTMADVSFGREEINFNSNREFYNKFSIDDMGDLSTFFGYEEVDCTNMTAESGKVYDELFTSWDKVKALDFKDLMSKGYTAIKFKGKTAGETPPIPLNVLINKTENKSQVRLYTNPDLVISNDKGKVKYVIINGSVYDLDNFPQEKIKNALYYAN